MATMTAAERVRPVKPVIDWEELKNRKASKAWLGSLKGGEQVMMIRPRRHEAHVQTFARRMSFGIELRGGRRFSDKTGIERGGDGAPERDYWRIVPMTEELRQWSAWIRWVEQARSTVQAFRYPWQLTADELEIVSKIFNEATARGVRANSYGVPADELE